MLFDHHRWADAFRALARAKACAVPENEDPVGQAGDWLALDSAFALGAEGESLLAKATANVEEVARMDDRRARLLDGAQNSLLGMLPALYDAMRAKVAEDGCTLLVEEARNNEGHAVTSDIGYVPVTLESASDTHLVLALADLPAGDVSIWDASIDIDLVGEPGEKTWVQSLWLSNREDGDHEVAVHEECHSPQLTVAVQNGLLALLAHMHPDQEERDVARLNVIQ